MANPGRPTLSSGQLELYATLELEVTFSPGNIGPTKTGSGFLLRTQRVSGPVVKVFCRSSAASVLGDSVDVTPGKGYLSPP